MKTFLHVGCGHMAHKCGFTLRVLQASLRAAGFASLAGMQRGRSPFFDLWVVASKTPLPESALRDLAAQHFPA